MVFFFFTYLSLFIGFVFFVFIFLHNETIFLLRSLRKLETPNSTKSRDESRHIILAIL